MSAAIEKARLAYADLEVAHAEATAARRRLVTLEMEHRQASSELDDLREAKQRDDAERLLDGEDAVPLRPKRDRTIAKLDADLPSQLAAMELQRRRIADAERAATKIMVPFVAAVLELAKEVQGEAVDTARLALAALEPAFAQLIAADQIRAATIGDRYPVPTGVVPPFKGLTVIQRTAQAIPERVRPDELAEANLMAKAEAISAPIIALIKGN